MDLELYAVQNIGHKSAGAAVLVIRKQLSGTSLAPSLKWCFHDDFVEKFTRASGRLRGFLRLKTVYARLYSLNRS